MPRARVLPEQDASGCPFCEGREAATPPETFAVARPGRPADAAGWWVRVVPNKFPAFGPWPESGAGGGPFERVVAVGRQEVVVHTPRHASSLADLTARELGHVAAAWCSRAAAARAAGFPSVFALVNEGEAAGASLAHSHSQLIWLRGEPPLVEGERQAALADGSCLLCRMLAEERAKRVRVVYELDGFILLCPFAGRGPYEMLVAPLECREDPFVEGELSVALALVAEGLRRLHAAEGNVAVNVWLHAPGHWHLEVVPRLTVLAGLELGAGYYINTLAPESAAGVLREA